MRNVISILVQNVPGVLSHVSGLLAARGYNVDSLTVGKTENPAFSRMTIVLDVDREASSQVERQLQKLVTVVTTENLSNAEHVERELALIRVRSPKETRSEILEYVQIFRAAVVDVGAGTLLIEISGKKSKIDAFIDVLKPIGILCLTRSGCIATARDKSSTACGDGFEKSGSEENRSK